MIIRMQNMLDAFKIATEQIDGSMRTANRCSKYRFLLEQQAGSMYRSLLSGRGYKKSSGDLTTKQEAEVESGRSRETLNQWARQGNVSRENVDKYEKECNAYGLEFTSKGAMKKYRKRGSDSKPKRERRRRELDIVYGQLMKLENRLLKKYRSNLLSREDLVHGYNFFRNIFKEILSEIEKVLDSEDISVVGELFDERGMVKALVEMGFDQKKARDAVTKNFKDMVRENKKLEYNKEFESEIMKRSIQCLGSASN